jgi:AraC-like DNA-binding protein
MLSQPGQTLTIAQIAARVGLPSPAHFSRIFRAHYGISPRDLRGTLTATNAPDRDNSPPAGLMVRNRAAMRLPVASSPARATAVMHPSLSSRP